MQVVLREDVESLGLRGDVVNVAEGRDDREGGGRRDRGDRGDRGER